MNLTFYLLVHEHQYGKSIYGFYFEPSPIQSYPSVLRVVEKLGVDYEPHLGESVSLHTVEGGEPDLVLSAADVGSREPEYLDLCD